MGPMRHPHLVSEVVLDKAQIWTNKDLRQKKKKKIDR